MSVSTSQQTAVFVPFVQLSSLDVVDSVRLMRTKGLPSIGGIIANATTLCFRGNGP